MITWHVLLIDSPLRAKNGSKPVLINATCCNTRNIVFIIAREQMGRQRWTCTSFGPNVDRTLDAPRLIVFGRRMLINMPMFVVKRFLFILRLCFVKYDIIDGRVKASFRVRSLNTVLREFMEEFTVFTSPAFPSLVRIGCSPDRDPFGKYFGDGGYVTHPFRGVEVCYSYGISQEVSFDEEIVDKYGVKSVRQYDMTLGGKYVPSRAAFDFFDEGVGPVEDKLARINTVESQLAANGDTYRPKIMQMDVEGAEWETFMHMPFSVLDSFDQIILEAHRLDSLESIREKIIALRKLNHCFILVHAHFNNSSQGQPKSNWQPKYRKYEGVIPRDDGEKSADPLFIPRTLELSFVSRRLWPNVKVQKCTKERPLPNLDWPNVKGPDVMLNVFPWIDDKS